MEKVVLCTCDNNGDCAWCEIEDVARENIGIEAYNMARMADRIAYKYNELVEENKRLTDIIKKSKDKTQILASHCAVQMDRGSNVSSHYSFEKSQEIYELLKESLRE
jgi:N-acetyl-anhydromuramyl-L-alanine amidase AmpD